MSSSAPGGENVTRIKCAKVGNKERCLKPKDTFRDCPNCPEMAVIPAGALHLRLAAVGEGPQG
jgi:hypothetical protein